MSEETASLGRWASMHLASLKANRPDLYQRLKSRGELDAHLTSIEEHASQAYDSTLAALTQAHPAPSGASFLERSQHLASLASSAEEMILPDVLVKDEETSRAESEGYR